MSHTEWYKNLHEIKVTIYYTCSALQLVLLGHIWSFANHGSNPVIFSVLEARLPYTVF